MEMIFMNITIKKGTASGVVSIPSSKSVAHRLLINAALTDGETVIGGLSLNEDISATIDCLRTLGAKIEYSDGLCTVCGISKRSAEFRKLYCRESGSTLRFMIPLCLDSVETELYGSPRLIERPHTVYSDLCVKNGFLWQTDSEKITVCGSLKSGVYEVPGNISSQFITGLMLALPTLDGDSIIRLTTEPASLSYIDMTVASLAVFGINVEKTSEREWLIKGSQKRRSPGRINVEADESGAAFFGALNYIGGDVKLNNLNENSCQGDRVWRSLFPMLKSGKPEISIKDCPDLGPILMALAACLNGVRLTDTARLKIKESDRGSAMAQELGKFGVKVTVDENTITVDPSGIHSPAEPLCSHNDHRIVMSLAVMLTKFGGEIDEAQAVNKSMPQFFTMLGSLGINTEEG
ncbi:MAG TPA: 3-phosphoshikimate 1-carboxyvinyltransferase [Ruminococcaceae bacterium]|nr:3-phosphoshikimate 1-carboxyvinyltransferase [Oscillospiraceae bacterium]